MVALMLCLALALPVLAANVWAVLLLRRIWRPVSKAIGDGALRFRHPHDLQGRLARSQLWHSLEGVQRGDW